MLSAMLYLQAITLIGALHMIATAHLKEKSVTIEHSHVKEFKTDMLQLLANPTSSLQQIQEYMHQFVNQVLKEHGAELLSHSEKDFLSRMTDKTASTEDAFYRQMNKTVMSVIWRSLRSPYNSGSEQVLRGLTIAMKDEVSKTARLLRKIVVHNMNVHSELFERLFRDGSLMAMDT